MNYDLFSNQYDQESKVQKELSEKDFSYKKIPRGSPDFSHRSYISQRHRREALRNGFVPTPPTAEQRALQRMKAMQQYDRKCAVIYTLVDTYISDGTEYAKIFGADSPFGVGALHDCLAQSQQGKEEDSGDDDNCNDDLRESDLQHLAPMEDADDSSYVHEPYQSENHKTNLKEGEILVGGMPRHKNVRPKGKQRTQQRGQSRIKTTRTPKALFANEYVADLAWIIHFNIAAAAATGRRALIPNSTYQPDPGNTSLVAYGLSELATLYYSTRILKFRVEVTCTNLDSNPAEVIVVPSNTDPTLSGVSQDTAAAMPGAIMRQVSAKGGMDRSNFTRSYFVPNIAGTKSAFTDDSFAGSFSADPTDKIWLSFFVSSMGASNITNGVSFTVKLIQTVHCYSLRQDLLLGVPRPQILPNSSSTNMSPTQNLNSRSDKAQRRAELLAEVAALDMT